MSTWEEKKNKGRLLDQYEVDIPLVGADERLNNALMVMHYYGTFDFDFDPTDHPPLTWIRWGRYIFLKSDNEPYLPHGSDNVLQGIGSPSLENTFQHFTIVVVFTYNVASKHSLFQLEELYHKIPQPAYTFSHSTNSPVIAPNQRKIRIPSGTTKKDEHKVVAMDRFPIVLVGCHLPGDKTREVETADVERVMKKFEHCTFAGECDVGVVEEVDAIYRAAIEVVHALRQQAVREEDLEAFECNKKTKRNSMRKFLQSLWAPEFLTSTRTKDY